MTALQIFNNPQFGEIRAVEIDGKPYFVASDIAKALGYKDTTNAIKQHCRWVVKHHIPHPQSPIKTIEVNVIPEGGLNSK
jgi:anti-repressor protein